MGTGRALLHSILAFLIVAAWPACESASIRENDAGASGDSTVPDAGAPDSPGETDSGPGPDLGEPPPDLGPGDSGRPRAPTPAAPPIAPSDSPGLSWLPGTTLDRVATPEEVASAAPMVASPDPPRFGECAPWFNMAPGAEDPEPCEPWPTIGHQTCIGATEHFPGGAGCEPIGTSCPALGMWAAEVPTTGTVVYVSDSVGLGGTGTRASPFASLIEALDHAATLTPPVVVALTAGTYSGAVAVPTGVTILGACTSGTTMTAPGAVTVVDSIAGSTTIANLRIVGGDLAIRVGGGTAGNLDRVLIESGGEGILLNGGSTLSARRLVVRNMTREAMRILGGNCTLDLDTAVFRSTGGTALIVNGVNTLATLREVAVRDCPTGVYIDFGGRMEATGLVAENIGGVAIGGREQGSFAVTRGVFRGTGYAAIEIFSPVDSSLDAVLVDSCYGAAAANNPIHVRDTIVRDSDGFAIWATNASLERVRVRRGRVHAVVGWEHASITVRSLDAIDIGAGATTMTGGPAIKATDAATFVVERSRVQSARGAGVLVGGCEANCLSEMGTTTVTLSDVEVIGTLPGPGAALEGNGVLVLGNGSASVTRARLTDNAGPQIAAAMGNIAPPGFAPARPALVTLTDVVVRSSSTAGPGLRASEGARIEGTSILVGSARDVGIESRGDDSTIDLDDVIVADTQGASSVGVLASDDGQLLLSASHVLRSASAAAHATGGGVLTLTDVLLAQSEMAPAGDGLLVDAFGQARLTRVELRDFARTAMDVRGDDTVLTASDVTVRRVPGRASSMEPDGFGVVVRQSATATLGGLLVERAGGAAVLVLERGSRATLSDVTVQGGDELATGAGLIAHSAGTLVATACLIQDVAGIAAGAFDGATVMELTAVRVARVHAACAMPPCAATGFGAYETAMLTISSFADSECQTVGAQSDSDAILSLTSGVISDSPIGAEIPMAASATLDGVVFDRCTTDVSSTPGPRPPPIAAPD